MSISVIVGAQYGDEGKSKVARWWGEKYGVTHAIKIGGYTSKSVFINNEEQVFHMLPAASNFYNSTDYLFPRCSYVILDELWKECKERIVDQSKIHIDPFALVSRTKDSETMNAVDCPEIKENLLNIHDAIINLIASDMPYEILIEADGGYGLSAEVSLSDQIHRAPTMTAAGVAYLLDINPSDINDVALVSNVTVCQRQYRSPSQILDAEEVIDRMIMSEKDEMDTINSFSALSSKLKGMDIDLVRNAYISSNPDFFFINGIDRISPNSENPFQLTSDQLDFLNAIRNEYGLSVDYIGVGPNELARLKYEIQTEGELKSEVEGEKTDRKKSFMNKISEEANEKFSHNEE